MRSTNSLECLDLALFVRVLVSSASSEAFFRGGLKDPQSRPNPNVCVLFAGSGGPPVLLYKRPLHFFSFSIISHIIAPPNLYLGVKGIKDHHQPPSICEVLSSVWISSWKTCLRENKSHPFQAAFPLACLCNIVLGASLAKACSAAFHELTFEAFRSGLVGKSLFAHTCVAA